MARQNRSGGMISNLEHFAAGVAIEPGVDEDLTFLLYDPQTSGGLLIAADPGSADQMAAALEASGVRAWRIGSAVEPRPGGIRIQRAGLNAERGWRNDLSSYAGGWYKLTFCPAFGRGAE